MTLREVKIGQKFLFVNGLTDVYVKRGPLNDEYCVVGLAAVYDVFAAPLSAEVITED